MPSPGPGPNADARPVYRRCKAAKAVELLDDLSGLACATTVLEGKAPFARLEIDCPLDGSRWRSSPNRRVLPTRWRLEEVGGESATEFSHRVGPKLLDPLGRTLLSLERGGDGPAFHVVDARRDGVGRLLNLARSEWILMGVGGPVATIGLSRRPATGDGEEARPGGMFHRLAGVARAVGSHDLAVKSLLPAHALEPAEALVLLLLFEALTENL